MEPRDFSGSAYLRQGGMAKATLTQSPFSSQARGEVKTSP
ncbi:MAG: hypothetical protein RL230_2193 [Pseudomonadota bacterium]